MKYLLLMCLVPSILFAQNDPQIYRSAYFAKAPFYESPLHPFLFAQEINSEDASIRVHLKVDYDRIGRVVQISLRLGDHLKDLDGAFFGMNVHAPVCRISYEGSKETHTFYDRFGNRVDVMGGVFQKVYQKDELGRNITLSLMDKENKLIDAFGGASVFNWSYESDGSVIETRYDIEEKMVPLRGGFQFMRTRMIYGPQGYFAMLQNINDHGDLINSESGAAVYKYYFDGLGRFLRWEVYDKDLKPAKGPSNTAGEENIYEGFQFLGIDFFDTDHKSPAVHWSGAERFRMTNDQFGNQTTRAYQSASGELMPNGSGIALIKNEWSADGRFLLSTAYFDHDDEKVESNWSGHHRVEYIRGDNGLLMEKRHYDISGKLKSHKESGVAVIRYEYDEVNKLIKALHLDENEKPV